MNVNESRKRVTLSWRWLGGLATLLLAGCGQAATPGTAAPGREPDVRRDSTVEAVEKVMPSVVNIATATLVEYNDFYDRLLREFYGLGPRREEKLNSIGSGVIIDDEGYILTNLHVLRRATRVQVKLWDGREYEADPLLTTPGSDVALLKIRGKPGEKFKAIKLAGDDDLLLGETVLALGNPFGLGESVSRGILSSKTRRAPMGDEPLQIADWLQTDAAINPGNSGGPLVNLRGELIGLNVAVYQGQGIGFAIPIKQVSLALSQFFTPEVQHSLWFGARFKPGTMPLTASVVQPGSPADKAGLRAGQAVWQVNGKSPRSLVELSQMVGATGKAGINLQVGQNAERRTITVTPVPFDELIQQKLGLVLRNLTPQIAAKVPANSGESLYIEEVEKDGPAAKVNLQRGYLLAGMDGVATGNLWAAADILAGKKPGDSVKLSVISSRPIGQSYVQFQKGDVSVRVR